MGRIKIPNSSVSESYVLKNKLLDLLQTIEPVLVWYAQSERGPEKVKYAKKVLANVRKALEEK